LPRSAPTRVAAFLGDGLVERRHAAPDLLQFRAQHLEGSAILLLHCREALQHFRHKGSTGIGCRLLDQPIKWIANLLGRIDGLSDEVLGFVLIVVVHFALSSVRRAQPSSMSLKSRPCGGRAMRTRRPWRFLRKAQSRAAASPASSPSAKTITLRTCFGRSRARSPEVESAAQAGWPVASMAVRLVSMPSPTRSTSLGLARRTAPPRHGPSIIFCGLTGAFPAPSRVRKVRWRASGLSSKPRVTSATITGQMPPDGCLKAAWKRNVGGGVRWRPREAR